MSASSGIPSRSTLLAVWWLALGLAGCEEQGTPAVSHKRSEAITAAPGAAPAPQAATARTTEKSLAAAPRGPLCSSKPNTPLPQTKVGGMGSLDQPFAGGTPGLRGPAWINLWAAWCEPCKKELPLLERFQAQLEQAGQPIRLEFVSIDDDPRQLQRFLDEQPSSGLKQTYWLREGKERQEWLPEAGLSPDPRLPVHLLVDAQGKIFCRIEGSVEEGDFDAVKAAFSGL